MAYPFLDYIIFVIGLIITIGGAILAFNFKIARCLARHEANIADIKETVNRLANALLSHLDGRSRAD